MLAAYAKRGVKAGAVAGLAFGVLVALVANPLVAFADELAAGGDHGGGGDHHGAASPVDTGAASVAAGVLWGVLLGAGFGVAYYLLEPALPGTGAARSSVLAAAGFLTVSGAPWLVLPPGVDVGATLPTGTRIAAYAGMMVAGGVASLLAVLAYGRFRGAHGRVAAGVLAACPPCLLAVPAALAPPAGGASGLPPDLAAGLTGLAVFGQALVWLVLAWTHALLRRRAADGRAAGVDAAGHDPPAD